MSGVPFNPREILLKLRAKNNIQAGAGNGSLDSASNAYLGGNGFNKPDSKLQQGGGHSEKKLTEDEVIASEEAKAIRVELEKDLQRMQYEMKQLKKENANLKEELEDKDREFLDFKIKSEDLIVQLRGKLASVYLGVTPVPAVDTKPHTNKSLNGKMYSPNPRFGSSRDTYDDKSVVHEDKKWHLAGTGSYDFSNEGAESFRDPTFSELMRRTTGEHHDFVGSLRKPGLFSKGFGASSSGSNSASKPASASTRAPNASTRSNQQDRLYDSGQFIPNDSYYDNSTDQRHIRDDRSYGQQFYGSSPQAPPQPPIALHDLSLEDPRIKANGPPTQQSAQGTQSRPGPPQPPVSQKQSSPSNPSAPPSSSSAAATNTPSAHGNNVSSTVPFGASSTTSIVPFGEGGGGGSNVPFGGSNTSFPNSRATPYSAGHAIDDTDDDEEDLPVVEIDLTR